MTEEPDPANKSAVAGEMVEEDYVGRSWVQHKNQSYSLDQRVCTHRTAHIECTRQPLLLAASRLLAMLSRGWLLIEMLDTYIYKDTETVMITLFRLSLGL